MTMYISLLLLLDGSIEMLPITQSCSCPTQCRCELPVNTTQPLTEAPQSNTATETFLQVTIPSTQHPHYNQARTQEEKIPLQ